MAVVTDFLYRITEPLLRPIRRAMPNLGGIDISREELDRLKQELPRVKIDWTEANETYQKRIRALFGEK